MVVARAQVQIGEAAVFELRRQGRIAAHQGRGAEVVALGLEDLVLVDAAELADAAIDGADVVGLRQRTGIGAQCAREKVVEARVVRDVRVQRLIHVDVVAADEPADQTRGHGAAFGASDAAGKIGQRSFWEQILRQDGKTVRHDGKPLTGGWEQW